MSGKSGSGKTVSALSILRLLPYPDASHPSGEIMFEGEDLLRVKESEIRRVRGNRISIIFQEPMTSLNPLHSVEKQVSEVLKIHHGMSNAAARRRTLELLTKVGIQNPEIAPLRVSAPTVGRTAAARDDRDGTCE